MNKTFTRKNVGGVIFSCPEGAYRTIEAWFEAKCPSNALVYDLPYNLIRIGLKVVDGAMIDGIYYPKKLKVPEETTVIKPKTLNGREAVLEKSGFFPAYIYFDEAKRKVTRIGTTGPSKVSSMKAKK